jgi:hypothetical protein
MSHGEDGLALSLLAEAPHEPPELRGAATIRSRSPRSSTSTGSTSEGCAGEIGHVPPAEFEEVFYASMLEEQFQA